MTATTQDRSTPRSVGDTTRALVAAATKLYGNTLVNYNAARNAVAGTDTTAEKFAGIAVCQVDNSGGAAGDEVVVCYQRGQFQFTIAAAVLADIGKKVYVVDNNTVGLEGTTTNDVYCGVIKEIVSATEVIISIDEAAQAGA